MKSGFNFFFFFAIDDLRDGMCVHLLGEDLQPNLTAIQAVGIRPQVVSNLPPPPMLLHPSLKIELVVFALGRCEVADFIVI